MTSQQSEIFKIKTALTIAIQQIIIKFCEIAGVSSTLIREVKSLLLYQTLKLKFYHLKEQIKTIKQLDIDLEKIRSLINSYLLQTVKPLASIPPSANATRK